MKLEAQLLIDQLEEVKDAQEAYDQALKDLFQAHDWLKATQIKLEVEKIRLEEIKQK